MQRLSHRLSVLANDSQLWKSLYYTRFVLPRALRIPGIRVSRDQPASTLESRTNPRSLHFSSRRSKWLDDDALVNRADGKKTYWKGQYKLRHNWAIGVCEVQEIRVGEKLEEPGLLVRLVEGIVVTADAEEGLRAWDTKSGHVVACQKLASGRMPTSLAADTRSTVDGDGRGLGIAVGYADGGFGVWELSTGQGVFKEMNEYKIKDARPAKLDAIAYSYPYLLTITDAQVLSLYVLKSTTKETDTGGEDISVATPNPELPDAFSIPAEEIEYPTEAPKMKSHQTPHRLASLKSHTAWPPLSLCIRSTSNTIIASIAYALPTYLSGWSVGLQELHLTLSGEISKSRLTSAVDQGFQSLLPLSRTASPDVSSSSPDSYISINTSDGRGRTTSSRPTTLSYSHPYLLASHADNTLTLYLVNSNFSDLTISAGTKLWGHTSSVSGAHVGGRGKAVSVSTRGNELRVWELEGGLGSVTSRKRLGTRSVQVRPEKASNDYEDLQARKGWVGFDDETVIVLKESGEGTQALVVYDFT